MSGYKKKRVTVCFTEDDEPVVSESTITVFPEVTFTTNLEKKISDLNINDTKVSDLNDNDTKISVIDNDNIINNIKQSTTKFTKKGNIVYFDDEEKEDLETSVINSIDKEQKPISFLSKDMDGENNSMYNFNTSQYTMNETNYPSLSPQTIVNSASPRNGLHIRMGSNHSLTASPRIRSSSSAQSPNLVSPRIGSTSLAASPRIGSSSLSPSPSLAASPKPVCWGGERKLDVYNECDTGISVKKIMPPINTLFKRKEKLEMNNEKQKDSIKVKYVATEHTYIDNFEDDDDEEDDEEKAALRYEEFEINPELAEYRKHDDDLW